ncbi:MAG: histone deacetylase family protein, partial [Actinomycetia bacterium]|nr:histone deacetylase family protein [Actinomycetes bacterium]
SRGTEAPVWFAALSHGTAWIEAAGADALVVSLGVDTYELDPISHFRLGAGHYPMLGAALAGLGLPTVLIMEGGYATAQVGANVAAVLTGFVSG